MELLLLHIAVPVVISLAGGAAILLPRIVIPRECYIWFSKKHEKALGLICALLLPVTGFWAFMLMMIPLGISDVIRTWDRLPLSSNLQELGVMLLVALGPVALVLLLRCCLHAVWKPTPEMIAYNDAVIAAEVEQMEKARLAREEKEAERKRLARDKSARTWDAAVAQHQQRAAAQAGSFWHCQICRTRNKGTQPVCKSCGEGCRPLSM